MGSIKCLVCGETKDRMEFDKRWKHDESSRGMKKRCRSCKKELRRIKNGKEKDLIRRGFDIPQKCVYALVDKFTKEVVYVGESIKGPLRMYQHFTNSSNAVMKEFLSNKEKREYFGYIILEDANDMSNDQRLKLEYMYELKFKPKLNKRWQQE